MSDLLPADDGREFALVFWTILPLASGLFFLSETGSVFAVFFAPFFSTPNAIPRALGVDTFYSFKPVSCFVLTVDKPPAATFGDALSACPFPILEKFVLAR